MDLGESPEEAARRELYEETGLSAGKFTQVGVFGEAGRDPRGWVVSVAYAVRLECGDGEAVAGDDASKVQWWPVSHLPALAFDHAKIVEMALSRIRTEESAVNQEPTEPFR